MKRNYEPTEHDIARERNEECSPPMAWAVAFALAACAIVGLTLLWAVFAGHITFAPTLAGGAA